MIRVHEPGQAGHNVCFPDVSQGKLADKRYLRVVTLTVCPTHVHDFTARHTQRLIILSNHFSLVPWSSSSLPTND